MTPVDKALLVSAEQILRINGYEAEAGAVGRVGENLESAERDAGRYRWLADCNNYEAGLELIIDPKLTAHTLGEKIDAAMLAAK